jgi:hypothetical protein
MDLGQVEKSICLSATQSGLLGDSNLLGERSRRAEAVVGALPQAHG